jgi:hypothetical protein
MLNPVLEFLKKQAANHNLIFASADRNRRINAFDPEWSGVTPRPALISPEGKILHREKSAVLTRWRSGGRFKRR